MIIWTVNYLILPMSILNIILVLLSSLHELFFCTHIWRSETTGEGVPYRNFHNDGHSGTEQSLPSSNVKRHRYDAAAGTELEIPAF